MSAGWDKSLPNPGSSEAGERGCTCPVIDNGRGRGFRGQPDVFVTVQGCPLHWPVLTPTREADGK